MRKVKIPPNLSQTNLYASEPQRGGHSIADFGLRSGDWRSKQFFNPQSAFGNPQFLDLTRSAE